MKRKFFLCILFCLIGFNLASCMIGSDDNKQNANSNSETSTKPSTENTQKPSVKPSTPDSQLPSTPSTPVEELKLEVSKTKFEFTYGVTETEIKTEISQHVTTNGTITYSNIPVDCCENNEVSIIAKKGSNEKAEKIKITINPNRKAFKVSASTATDNWCYDNKPDKFTFVVYIENNSGKTVLGFESLDFAYCVEGYVRVCGGTGGDAFKFDQPIKNGEKRTLTLWIPYAEGFYTLSKSKWVEYYEAGLFDKLPIGYDYGFWSSLDTRKSYSLDLGTYGDLIYQENLEI